MQVTLIFHQTCCIILCILNSSQHATWKTKTFYFALLKILHIVPPHGRLCSRQMRSCREDAPVITLHRVISIHYIGIFLIQSQGALLSLSPRLIKYLKILRNSKILWSRPTKNGKMGAKYKKFFLYIRTFSPRPHLCRPNCCCFQDLKGRSHEN